MELRREGPPPRGPEAETTDLERAAPVSFVAGDLLCDRFFVVRFIARGGMGELYEAEDRALGERVALKTIRPEIGEKGTAAESRAALAVLALEEGRAGDAEALAREAAAVFEGQSASDNEAMARATMALALMAQGRRAPAQREVERARALVRNSQHVLARIPVTIAAARIDGVVNSSAAMRALESIRAEATERGIPFYVFQARHAMAEIEGRRSSAAGAALLEGFGLW